MLKYSNDNWGSKYRIGLKLAEIKIIFRRPLPPVRFQIVNSGITVVPSIILRASYCDVMQIAPHGKLRMVPSWSKLRH